MQQGRKFTEDIVTYLIIVDKETKHSVHYVNINNFLKTMCGWKVPKNEVNISLVKLLR